MADSSKAESPKINTSEHIKPETKPAAITTKEEPNILSVDAAELMHRNAVYHTVETKPAEVEAPADVEFLTQPEIIEELEPLDLIESDESVSNVEAQMESVWSDGSLETAGMAADIEILEDGEPEIATSEQADTLDDVGESVEHEPDLLTDEIDGHDDLAEIVSNEVDNEDLPLLITTEPLQDEPPEASATDVLAVPSENNTLIQLLRIEPAELEAKLEPIAPIKLLEAAAILELTIQTAKRLEENDEVGQTDQELVVAGLEQMVVRFFDCLEIEHTELDVERFVAALISGELEDMEPEFEKQTSDEGTHEHKYTVAWIIAVLNRSLVPKPSAQSFIGKYTLRLSILSNFQNLAAAA